MNKTIIKQFFICLLSGLVTFIVLLCMTALILLKVPMAQSSYMPIVFAISVICSALASFFATRITKLKGIVIGSITSAAFDIILAAILLVASSGSLSGKFFILAAVNIIVGAIAGIYAANLKRKH